jgi:uncharacterized protein YcaQ
VRTISIPALRSLVVSAQGYASRARRVDGDEVEAAIKRASCIQLDSISTVERSHRVAIAARVGDYPAGTVARQLSRGRIIEYWAHDLKSERRDGALVVRSFHLEPGVRRSRALDGAFDRALDRLRRTIGLQRVVR